MAHNPRRYNGQMHIMGKITSDVLDTYIKDMKFGEDEWVLDVGCGPGSATAEILMPRIRNTTTQLIASDLQEQMIAYAKIKYPDPKISYHVLDFGKPISSDVKNSFVPNDGFDKIFSFLCFMLIPDQRQAARNIYELLKPGGEALILMLSKAEMFHIYNTLSTTTKWKSYMTDAESCISPYQYSEHPDLQFKRYLEDSGLEVVKCEKEDLVIHFDDFTNYKELLTALNMFTDRIPEKLREEFARDWLTVLHFKGDETSADFKPQILIAHVKKLE